MGGPGPGAVAALSSLHTQLPGASSVSHCGHFSLCLGLTMSDPWTSERSRGRTDTALQPGALLLCHSRCARGVHTPSVARRNLPLDLEAAGPPGPGSCGNGHHNSAHSSNTLLLVSAQCLRAGLRGPGEGRTQLPTPTHAQLDGDSAFK